MFNVPEKGSQGVCPHCALKPRNGHSIKQSGECDGIRKGTISGVRALDIRRKNGARDRRRDGSTD